MDEWFLLAQELCMHMLAYIIYIQRGKAGVLYLYSTVCTVGERRKKKMNEVYND